MKEFPQETEETQVDDIDELRKGLVDRLKRVEGQVRGLQRMIAEGRDCTEVLPQLAAVLAATKRVASILAYCSLTERVSSAIADGRNPHEAVRDLVDLLARMP
ncbi:MAG: metal-sensitive transcriptional regulator [Armatimonadetes bacterium]|nr:metal-sensitive transcriptional regulator [Armatimonadota bacterium]